MPLENELSFYPRAFRKASVGREAIKEAKARVADSLGCFFGGVDSKPARLLRETMATPTKGETLLWGSGQSVPAEIAAWANGTSVRALDYNDTYLSKEPCHPSDLLASLWAACEISGSKNQGRLLLKSLILGYEVVCRLCDAQSLRLRGWDHVNYLSIASAVACSYIFNLSPEKTRHAVALAVVGNNALRQTRVGVISDWKAACAAYAARSGLWGARLASNGFTGPGQIFSGRHGFFNQVSGAFTLSPRSLKPPWKILSTHVKYFPAEHHAQSAIEAALALSPYVRNRSIRTVEIESFDAAVDIIGSEREKWRPTTRETADHSLPYLVCAALTKGDINLRQYENKLFLEQPIRRLMNRTQVQRNTRFTSLYPRFLPARVTVALNGGNRVTKEVFLPKGYAGRPLSESELKEKFDRLTSRHLSHRRREKLIREIFNIDEVGKLKIFSYLMRVNTVTQSNRK